MKNCLRALLLVTIASLLLSPVAMANDVLSAILPSPYTTRVGTQLVYFYEDSTSGGARGPFQSFLTITNTSITTGVFVHFQFYIVVAQSGSSLTGNTDCTELFDFVDFLTPGQRFIFDPKGIRRPSNFGGGAIVGTATDGRFIMTATPIVNFIANDLRVLSFNWLTGQIWVSDINKSATWMTNAVSRLAVNTFGGPLPDGVVVQGAFLTGTVADFINFSTFLQMFRPQIILVNSFFKTAGAGAVQPGVPFGNRMTMLTWQDQYIATSGDLFYRIRSTTTSLSSFVFDDQENAYSVPPRTVRCLQEWVIAPDVAGASGNWPDFLGSALTSAVSASGGWLRMRVAFADNSSYNNLVGWFSQYLGTYGGGDYMVGIGRQGLVFTTANPSRTEALNGVIMPFITADYAGGVMTDKTGNVISPSVLGLFGYGTLGTPGVDPKGALFLPAGIVKP